MNKLLTQLLLSCLLWLVTVSASANDSQNNGQQRPIAIIDNLDLPFDLSPYIELLEDPDHHYTIADIRSGKLEGEWKTNQAPYFVGHNIKSKYWFRVSIRTNTTSEQSGILYLYNQHSALYRLRFFLPAENWQEIVLGHLEPYNSTEQTSIFFSLAIKTTPGATFEVIGWTSNKETSIPIKLPLFFTSEQSFNTLDRQFNLAVAVFYGAMFSMIVYNFFLFVTLKEKKIYGLYLIFLVNGSLQCALLEGTVLRFLLPNNPVVNHYLNFINGVLMAISYLAFVFTSLSGVLFSKLIKRSYYFLLMLSPIFLIYVLLTGDHVTGAMINQLYGGATMYLSLIAIIIAAREKYPSSGYLLVAELTVVVGASSYLGMVRGITPINNFTLWGLHWGTLAEALLLSLALAARTRLAQQSAIENLKKYETLYTDSIEGFFDYDLTSNELKCNRAFANLFGYANVQELPPSHAPLELFDNTVQAELPQLLAQSGFVTDYEAQLLSPMLQSPIWVSLNMRLVKDGKGKALRTEGSMVNVTERKLKELSEMNYKKIYDETHQGLFTYSIKDNSFTCNKAWAKIAGYDSVEEYSAHNVPGQDFRNVGGVYSSKELFKMLLQDGCVRDLEMKIRRINSSNQQNVAMVTMSLILNAEGQPDIIEGSGVDITDRKLAEVAETERAAAEARNQAKSQFFASMSHELRTPLTAILGYSEAALGEAIENKMVKDSLSIIHRGGQHLMQIINDILDLAKIEAQKLDVESIQVYVQPLLEDIQTTMDVLAKRKGLVFTVCCHYPLPKIITSDPTRLKQILLNLCGNAIKFTEKGQVIVTVSCNKQNETMSFAIEDTGFGLKPEQVETLFAAFTQADASTTRNYGGTGLGLHLSKQLAQKLGGDITVVSVYGEGSTFTLSITTDSLQNIEWLGAEINPGKSVENSN